MPTLAEIAQVMAENSAFLPGKTVKFDFGADGCLFLDGVNSTVNTDNGSAGTTLTLSLSDFLAMADGTLNGTMAFMQGKLKVEGDMSAAMQLQSVTSKIKLR